MNKIAFTILRLGLGITFVLVGIFILRNPDSWGFMIQPWALKLLGSSLHQAMISTAYLDLAIGTLLLINIWTWLAAGVGAFHLVTVLITVGVNEITVRDIGLLVASAALAIDSLPKWVINKLGFANNDQIG